MPPNPYTPPAAPVTSRNPDGFGSRTRELKFKAVSVALVTNVTAGFAPAAHNSFRELFAGFGAELPLLSRIVLGSLWIWSLLAVASIGVAVVVLFFVSLVSLYLPIFRLGAVV